MNIYLLPGLGADERLFKYLDLKEYSVHHIRWAEPLKNESIEDYARRISLQIVSENPVIIGQSFGGMMAMELSKIIAARNVILISSAATYKDLPRLYVTAGRFKFLRMFSTGLLKNSHRMMNWIMGAADPIRRELLADMLRDTNEKFLYWAVEAIVNWRNTTIPTNLSVIHGDKDLVLPFRRADYRIKGGGHLMVVNRAPEVSAAIKQILS